MFSRKILDHLNNWKSKKNPKPLLLRGARQVGKTSACLLFAEKHFQNLIHINLEKADHQRLFRENISLEDFEQIVQIKFKKQITPHQTLVFLDEIQNSPALIKLLRFFYEERPELRVIAAGSLLETMIEKEGFSFPVGRVESAYLYPLDFFEFLEAKRENELLRALKNTSPAKQIPDAIHKEALKQFYEYVMVGGMPEVVKSYFEYKNTENLGSIYGSLLTGFGEDVFKYSSHASAKYLNFIIDQVPLFAGTTVTYEKFGNSNFRSREMSRAFSTLEKTMLLYQVQATRSTELPLVGQPKRVKKLLFLDVGLVNYRMGIQEEYLNFKASLNDFYRGRIAEQVVGQNILAQFTDRPPNLLYWAKERPEGDAEVDFCLVQSGRIVAIEVKAGTANNLRSLLSFAHHTKNHTLMRIYAGTLKREKIKVGSESFDLLSIPFYLLPRMFEF